MMKSDTKQKLIIIVPVYNEAANIPRLFDSFTEIYNEFGSQFDICFIIVDDGSTDGTLDAIQKLSAGMTIMILPHEKNMGPGCAFATAFKFIAEFVKDDDWVITMEGDNTSNHRIIWQMITRTKEGYDVVLASPYMYGGGITNTTNLRVLLSYGANIFVKEILGLHGFFTVSSFYRLYRGSILKKLFKVYGNEIIESTGFECMVELVLKMVFIKASISEIPMLLNTDLRAGKSKMKLLKTIFRYLTLFKYKGIWEQKALIHNG